MYKALCNPPPYLFCIAVILSKSQSYVNREESDPEELTGESKVVVRSEALIVY